MAQEKVRCDAVLVDIDGTLVDSNDAHARAWVAALKRHGHEFPHDAVRPLIGKGGDKLLDELLGFMPDSAEARAIARTAKRSSGPLNCTRSSRLQGRASCC